MIRKSVELSAALAAVLGWCCRQARRPPLSTYTYQDRGGLVDVSGFETFRQVAWGNSWEGTSTIGLGVRDHLPFRILILPGRIVIDVAHDR